LDIFQFLQNEFNFSPPKYEMILNKEAKADVKTVKGKTNKSKLIGNILAKKALEKDIKQVVFDRGGFRYHGRVKALADGAREGGLVF